MTTNTTHAVPSGPQDPPPWTNPDLPSSQFLYDRKGPWPQPAPDYPLTRPSEVLNVPAQEVRAWTIMIGLRMKAIEEWDEFFGTDKHAAQAALAMPVPADEEFVRIMTATVYARYLRAEAEGSPYWVSDFTAMELIAPLPQTFCAPVVCRFLLRGSVYSCVSITFLPTPTRSAALVVQPADKAWNLAKVFACQGAAYHALFVVHPALHFPMDSVNAITKTAVPKIHPLFQALFPHTTYTLTLDNAVLEGEGSIVNNHPPAVPYDPLTAKGTDLKQLFAVGYAGYQGLAAYPRYNYMKPWMASDTGYGSCLALYFQPFLAFGKAIASVIPNTDPFVARWADYCSAQIQGFPGASDIFEGDTLATAIAIYMWDVSVAHGADHYSFAHDIAVKDKFLRIRLAPPDSVDDGADVQKVGDVTNLDDMTRAELANAMLFRVVTLPPNLIDTTYAFDQPVLQQAVKTFHDDLRQADAKVRSIMPSFMRLEAGANPLSYLRTIPASIQF